MNLIWNCNHYSLPKLDFIVSGTKLVLCNMSLTPSSLERCIYVTPSGKKIQNGLEFLLEDLGPINKIA